jgi:hypothetical protein
VQSTRDGQAPIEYSMVRLLGGDAVYGLHRAQGD